MLFAGLALEEKDEDIDILLTAMTEQSVIDDITNINYQLNKLTNTIDNLNNLEDTISKCGVSEGLYNLMKPDFISMNRFLPDYNTNDISRITSIATESIKDTLVTAYKTMKALVVKMINKMIEFFKSLFKKKSNVIKNLESKVTKAIKKYNPEKQGDITVNVLPETSKLIFTELVRITNITNDNVDNVGVTQLTHIETKLNNINTVSKTLKEIGIDSKFTATNYSITLFSIGISSQLKRLSDTISDLGNKLTKVKQDKLDNNEIKALTKQLELTKLTSSIYNKAVGLIATDLDNIVKTILTNQ